MGKYHLPFCFLFFTVFNFDEIHFIYVTSKKPLPDPRSQRFIPVFPATSFRVLFFVLQV